MATGELRARASDRSASLERLRREAGRLYMSGIFDVECEGGECTATGFVYRDESPDRPSIVTR